MTALLPLIADVVVKSTTLLVAAALADAALARRGSAATRHFVWALAMAALLALPAAIAALPHWQVRIPVERAALAQVARTVDVSADAPVNQPSTAPVALAPVVAASSPRPMIGIAIAVVTAIYAAGVLILLGRLALEPSALRRLAREARVVDDDGWRKLFDRCVDKMDVRRPVRLLRSPRDVMPFTFGTLAPAIVLPASAEAWTTDRRRAVLLHELAHVARRDCLAQRLSAVACAFYWPHPGVWFGARRLRVERELACDDRVLAAGAAARDYAGHLLELAHSLGRAPAPATALGMARARQLEQRLLAILDAARNRATLHRRGQVVAVALGLACLLPIVVLRAALVAPEVASRQAGAAPQADRASTPASDLSGTWEVRLSRDPGLAQVSIRTLRGNHGRTIALSQLPGITVDQITSVVGARVRLPIAREAGTFDVEGSCRGGLCAGTFVFEPNAGFAAELTRRGLRRPTPLEQMDLAIANVGVAYLDAMAAAGYAKPDLDTLVRAAQHGVDASYLRGMAALGYRTSTLDALIELRDHGVDPSYIRGMADAGYAHLSADDLRKARDHGADPVYARDMAALGFANLALDALIAARDHGVDQVYVRDMQALGHRLTLDDYRRTRDHGVDPTFIRGLAALGYRGLAVDALVGARDHGVDPAYVREMADVGYKGLALDDLIRLRDHGVDPAYVRRVQRSGAPHLSVDEIIERRDRGEDTFHDVPSLTFHIGFLWSRIQAWLRG